MINMRCKSIFWGLSRKNPLKYIFISEKFLRQIHRERQKLKIVKVEPKDKRSINSYKEKKLELGDFIVTTRDSER